MWDTKLDTLGCLTSARNALGIGKSTKTAVDWTTINQEQTNERAANPGI
jgi:hypothetical protein